MIQDKNTPLANYHANCMILNKLKPKNIDMVIVGHLHCDHIALIPMLFARGNCDARIIVPKNSSPILKEMWLDSAYINQRDCDSFSRKGDKNYTPLYTETEVYNALGCVEEIEVGSVVILDDNVSIRYTPSGHILCSCQTELFIQSKAHTRKILFTSDLGNPMIQDRKIFIEPFQPISSAQCVIGECTYGRRKGSMSKKDIELDQKKMKTVIEQYCIERNRRVLVPTFSLDRMPFILWELYCLFGKDGSFTVPILVDSPLSNRLLDCYSSILTEDAKEKFDQMMSWKNIKRIIAPEDSRAAIADNHPKIILASSGMLTAGRSVKWVQSILPHEDDCILFVGYAGEDTLAGRIKHSNAQKTININGKPYKNKCQIVDLRSYSSHMQRNELLNYYKNINAEKIYLVHGDTQARLEFKADLEGELEKSLKSTRVIIVNKGTKIKL